MMPNNDSFLQGFFQRYESLKGEAANIVSEREILKQLRREHVIVVSEQTRLKNDVEANQAFIDEQKMRIALVSSHWFYGTTAFQPQLWLRGGCRGKVNRASEKLERAQAEHPELELLAQAIQAKEAATRSRMQSQQTVYDRKAMAAKEVDSMQEELVQQYPSPELTRLQQQLKHIKQKQVTIKMRNVKSAKLKATLHKVDSSFRAAARKVCEAEQQYQQVEKIQLKIRNLCTASDETTDSSTTRTTHVDGGQKEVVKENVSHPCEYTKYGPSGKVVLTNRPCPSGCGFVVTWHASHCCGACTRSGQHGPNCDRVALSSQVGAQERWDRMQMQRSKLESKATALHSRAKQSLADAAVKLHDGINSLQMATNGISHASKGRIIISMPSQYATGCSSHCSVRSKAKDLQQKIDENQSLKNQQEHALERLQDQIFRAMTACDLELSGSKGLIKEEKNRIFDGIQIQSRQNDAKPISSQSETFVPTAYAVVTNDNFASAPTESEKVIDSAARTPTV